MLRNTTRDIELAGEVFMADTSPKRLRGLIARPPLRSGQAMIIKPSTGVHSFFMSYTIDAAYVDRDNRVVRLVPNLRPYRFGPIDLRSRYVVELPAGALERSGTREGDVLAFV